MSAGSFTKNLHVWEKEPKARIFSPYLNRWTQADTIVPGHANPQNLNRYTYVLNSPINLNDPSGHACNTPVEDGARCRTGYSETGTGAGPGSGARGSGRGGNPPGDIEDDADGAKSSGETILSDLARFLTGCDTGISCLKAERQLRQQFSAWELQVMLDLCTSGGPDGIRAVKILYSRNTDFDNLEEQSTGAKWDIFGNISLSYSFYDGQLPRPGDNKYAGAVGLIAHEAIHLDQGLLGALSLQGELEAWKVGFRVTTAIGGSQTTGTRAEILNLPDDNSLETLLEFRRLMKIAETKINSQTGKPELKYLGWLLPIWPLGSDSWDE